jgi:hypothetical protein
MPFTLTASINPYLPGAINLVVVGDPDVTSSITRVDGSSPQQPVRNYTTSGSGLETVVDCEAPLGRPVSYNLLDSYGSILAQSNQVTAPALPDGKGLLRSVLKPSVQWMAVEPQDERNVEWASSTSVHRVVGKDTPVVIGEVRQRYSGLMSFLCKSIAEADQMVALMRDGTALLLRHDPCAAPQTRDMLFYALDVTETRYGRAGWRLVLVDYQTTEFVPGVTEEPPFNQGWDFAALAASAPDFGTLASLWPNFAMMATTPKPAWTPRDEVSRAG